MKKVNFNNLVNEYHNKHLNKYYSLYQLTGYTGCGTTNLKGKVKRVMHKYKDCPNLISKKGKPYKIHYSIVDEFMPKYKLKSISEYSTKWNTFFTVNPPSNSVEFELFEDFFKAVTSTFPEESFFTTVETSFDDTRKNRHAHLITTMKKKQFEERSKYLVDFYFGKCINRAENIRSPFASVLYLEKANHMKGQRFWKGEK